MTIYYVYSFVVSKINVSVCSGTEESFL